MEFALESKTNIKGRLMKAKPVVSDINKTDKTLAGLIRKSKGRSSNIKNK